ncbi:MAG TPA: hypothetical protein VNZ45_18200 [Bacteroidia bacterium]|jgi:hypothetical protein|nr:hypothetical protein [Bacteroidia bacterium]
MKRKSLHIIIVLYMSLWAGTIMAQNYTQDMLKIKDGYKNKYHSYRMKFVFYPYDSLGRATDSMKGICKMDGSSYYYNISAGGSEYEYMRNGKYYLIVDHPGKVVALNTSSNSRPEMWNLSKVDSLLSVRAVKVSYKELNKSEGQYELTYSGQTPWNRLRLKFNRVNYTLESLYMYSDAKGKISGQKFAKPRVGIYYSDYSEKMPDNSFFSETKYFHSEGNKPVLAETYKGYKLLDYIHSNRQ